MSEEAERLADMMSLIKPSLKQSSHDDRPIVVMMCGIAGSGKTTLAKQIIETYASFIRLSVDEMVYAKYGLYGKDFVANDAIYERYLDEMDLACQVRFKELLGARQNIVLDRSLYAKADRDEFKKMVEEAGGRWVLVSFKPMSKETVWNRICERSARDKTANSAYVITRERFDGYWNGFEWPEGEGEIVIEVAMEDEGRQDLAGDNDGLASHVH